MESFFFEKFTFVTGLLGVKLSIPVPRGVYVREVCPTVVRPEYVKSVVLLRNYFLQTNPVILCLQSCSEHVLYWLRLQLVRYIHNL